MFGEDGKLLDPSSVKPAQPAHPQLGPVVRKAELDKAVAVRLAEIAAKGAAEGVPFPGGGGMIAPQAQSASAEITASGHPPRKPSV